MRKHSFNLLLCLSMLTVVSLPNQCQADLYYDFVALGGLSGTDSSHAYSVNNMGQIVGFCGSSAKATLFDATGAGNNTYLGGLVSDPDRTSAAYAVNNSGQIVGEANAGGDSGDHATLFNPTTGINVDLGTIGSGPGDGDDQGWARSINDAGEIVGWAMDSSQRDRAVLFDSTGGGANIDLGTLGGHRSRAESINNAGVIAGAAQTIDGHLRATLFDPTGGGDNVDLGTLGGTRSWAHGINELGTIVGWAEASDGVRYAAAWYEDGPISLGALGGLDNRAYSVNELGQIVGYAVAPDNSRTHAMLFDATGAGNNIDLNLVTNASGGWFLETALCINDNGWIVGWGTNPSGFKEAYLLQPGQDPQVIPLPSAVIFGVIGLGVAGHRLRRRQD